MSFGLAPSKSTVYVSNLPFSLTNSDLHKVFEKHGKIARVTIVKDNDDRRSKGVAFIMFIDRDAAHQCCRAVNNTEMFGRTIKCSIAKDNGRAQEFIKRRVYKDKSRCYECGDEGHLSYRCPKNLLGEREQPKKKEKKRKSHPGEDDDEEEVVDSDEDVGEDPKMDSLAAAIQYQQKKESGEDSHDIPSSSYVNLSFAEEPKRKKYKKDAYFSDEEDLNDED